MMTNKKSTRERLSSFWVNESQISLGSPAQHRECDAKDGNGLPLRRLGIYTGDYLPRSVLKLDDRRAPSSKWTARQVLYIVGTHGLGAMMLSGGINFVIAYAMYTSTQEPIYLFKLPNTLVGDLAVTVIAQTIITWVIEMFMVNNDLRKGKIQPIGFIAEPEAATAAASSRLTRATRWFLLLDHAKTPKRHGSRACRKCLFVLAQAVRAFVVSVVFFALMLLPSIGILTAVGDKEGGDWVFASRWAPQAFKGIVGGALALTTTPFFAIMWMVKCGWHGGMQATVTFSGGERV